MASHRRPSQRDVAELAGVSRTTVSFVLNAVPDANISPATRDRVWAAARELGFRPNELARSLRSSRSNVLGLITSEIATTPYAVAIIKGAQEAAFARHKTLLIIDTDGAEDGLADAVATMSRWQVEGLVLATDYHRAVTVPPGFEQTPTILVNCFARGSGADAGADAGSGADADAGAGLRSVVPDERQGGRLAAETLLAAGHRRIGFINGPDGYPASAGRWQGYLDAHRDAGVPVDPALNRTGDWWQESAARHTADLLDLAEPPTALFCANDWMAMGAYDVVKERGLRIPADVAVIGFDNRVEIAAHMRPPLTTVALPYREMGERAVAWLLDPEPTDGPVSVSLPCPLVSRESV